jgi:hypothetical protein
LHDYPASSTADAHRSRENNRSLERGLESPRFPTLEAARGRGALRERDGDLLKIFRGTPVERAAGTFVPVHILHHSAT